MHHEAVEAAPGVLLWLQEGALGQAMRQSIALYPLVEILHILGFVLLVGSIVALDLRLLGLVRFLPAEGLARHLLPLAIGGFLLAASAGSLLFTTEAVSIAANPAFRLKLVLLCLAGTNAAVFHLGPWRSVADWNLDRPPPLAARAGALASIMLWLGVITCGRLIAYF